MKGKRKTGKSQETEALLEGLPWCPVVKSLPSNARDMHSIPGQGIRIPHAMRQISPCTATKKSPACCNQRKLALNSEGPGQPKRNNWKKKNTFVLEIPGKVSGYFLYLLFSLFSFFFCCSLILNLPDSSHQRTFVPLVPPVWNALPKFSTSYPVILELWVNCYFLMDIVPIIYCCITNDPKMWCEQSTF